MPPKTSHTNKPCPSGFTFILTDNERFNATAQSRIRAHAASWGHGQRLKRRSAHATAVSPDYACRTGKGCRKEWRGLRVCELDETCKEQGVDEARVQELRKQLVFGNAVPTDFFLGAELDPFLSLPQVSLEQERGLDLNLVKRHMIRILASEHAIHLVVDFANQHRAMFASILLMAWSHYKALTGDVRTTELLELKREVIQLVRKVVASPTETNILNINAIIALGSPVVCSATTILPSSRMMHSTLAGEEADSSAGRADQGTLEQIAMRDHAIHRQAVITLIQRRGGTRTMLDSEIGRNMLGLLILCDAYTAVVNDDFSPDFTEEDLYPTSGIFHNKTRTPSIWYSPLYCPPGVKTNPIPIKAANDSAMYKLTTATQQWLETFEGFLNDRSATVTNAHEVRRELRTTLEKLPLTANSPTAESGYMYECCRLTTMLLLRAEANGCRLRDAACDTDILGRVAYALRKTDLYSLWGSQIGLLFWVVMSCYAAAPPGHFFRRTSNFLLTNFSLAIRGTDCHFAVALRPLDKLKWFERMCAAGEK